MGDVRTRVAVLAVAATATAIWPGAGAARDPYGPDAPFRPGEGLASIPARCETLPGWIDDAPRTTDRVSLTVEGTLSAVDEDGALAYLVICAPEEVQVLCVTYETGGRVPGDRAVVAGGFIPAEGRRVILDPCLASDPMPAGN